MPNSASTTPVALPVADRRDDARAALRRLPLAISVVAAIVALGFAAFTGHIWEDYFITFRSSLNLATGHGLVFEHGQRVHSFTSPLGTLLPALFAIGGGEHVIARALWSYRVVSVLALASALWVALRVAKRDGLAGFALGTAGLAWALDGKVVDFTINGMETGLLIFFIALTWHALASGARLLPTALAVTGLQWTRPDGFVFAGVLGLAWIAFGRPAEPSSSNWRDRAQTLAKAIALAVLLYLPWLIFAWSYYGSPIPHTITAKIPRYDTLPELLGALALFPWRLLFGKAILHAIFLPTYAAFGGWPEALSWLSRGLAVVAALGWAWPRVKPAGRVASAAFFLGGFYVEYIPPSPWYYPGWQSLGFVTLAYLLHALWSCGANGAAKVGPALARIGGASLVLVQIGVLGAVAWQMRAQQQIIENGHRRQIGEWLRAESGGRRATVYLEPLGYVGFFSGLKMLDYPGLCSPEVVAARKQGGSIIKALRPDWLVCRPEEAQDVSRALGDFFTQNYRVARIFNARPAVEAREFLPGRGYLYYDAVFIVFEKKDRVR